MTELQCFNAEMETDEQVKLPDSRHNVLLISPPPSYLETEPLHSADNSVKSLMMSKCFGDDSAVELEDHDDFDEDGCHYDWLYFMTNNFIGSNGEIQNFYWKDFIPGKIPEDVVESIDGKYIGRVKYKDQLLPGCIHHDGYIVVADSYGERVMRDNIKILCCDNPNRFYWEEANFNESPSKQMKNAFVGGCEEAYNLFIGKTNLEGEWNIGKVVPHKIVSHRGLQIWNKANELTILKKFHILKYNPTASDKDTVVQDFFWRNYSFNVLPKDAIRGVNGKDIYIGQVNYRENLLPVAIYPHENVAIGERAGKRQFHEEVQILCTPDSTNFYWEKVDFVRPSEGTMKNAVKGGRQDGYNLYVGRAYHEGKWKVGKVVPMSNVLYKGLQVWDKYNLCVIITEFEMLKCHASSPSGYKIVNYAPLSAQIPQEKPVPVLARFRAFLRAWLKRLVPPCCSAPEHYKANLLYSSSNQDFYWRDYTPGKIPQDAVDGCNGNYIGQVNYEGKILPACIQHKKNLAIAERYGKRVFTDNIKILCCPDSSTFTWERVDFNSRLNGKQLAEFFIGGHQDCYDLYVGKILLDGEWNIGKVVPQCIAPYKGLQVIDKNSEFNMYRQFYILKCNPSFHSHNNNSAKFNYDSL